MNRVQRLIVWGMISLVAATLLFAPWDFYKTKNAAPLFKLGPIFWGPDMNYEYNASVKLRIGTLLMEWIGLSIIGAGLLVLTKSPGPTRETPTQVQVFK